MLFVGGIQTYTVVWDLGDVGIGLMTIFNLAVLSRFPVKHYLHWQNMRNWRTHQ